MYLEKEGLTMSSKDVNTHQNNISGEEVLVGVVEKGNADTPAPDVKPSKQVDEQDPPMELDDDELATVAGAGSVGLVTSLVRFGKSEFGRTSIAGSAGIGSGVASYSIVHAIF